MPLGGFALARNDKTGELPRRRGRPLDGPFPFRYAPRGVVGAAPYDFLRRRDGPSSVIGLAGDARCHLPPRGKAFPPVGTARSRPRFPARTN